MHARKSLLILLSRVLGGGMGLVALVFIGRYMDPASFGKVGFAVGLLGMLGAVGNLGLSQAHVKRISEGRDLGACIGTYARLRGLLVGGVTLAFLAAMLLWHRLYGFTDATTLAVVLIMTARHVLEQARLGVVDTLRGLRRTAMWQSIETMDTFARVVATVVAVVVYAGVRRSGGLLGGLPSRITDALGITGDWGVNEAAELLAVAFLVGMLASFLLAWRYYRRLGVPRPRFDPAVARSYWRFALPMALISIVGVLANQMDTVMVGYFWSAREVGYYFAAQRLMLVANVLPFAVASLFFPFMSELAAARQREGAAEVARTAQRLLMLVALPVFVLLLVFRTSLLHVFVGDAYLPAAPILGLLSLHMLLLSASAVSASVVRGFDLPRLAMAAGVATMGTNFILNVVMIPESLLGVPLLGLKAQGAALATALSQIVGMAILLASSRRVLGRSVLDPDLLRQAAALVLVLGAVVAADATGRFPAIDRVWELAGAAAAVAALHIGLLWILRGLTRKDILFFADLLHPGKMGRYVREELWGKRP